MTDERTDTRCPGCGAYEPKPAAELCRDCTGLLALLPEDSGWGDAADYVEGWDE